MIETRNGRSETEILSRSGIPVAMGDATYWMRPLTMDGADEWEGKIRDVLTGMFAGLANATGGIDGILGLYRQSVDASLDALYAYDEIGQPDLAKRALPARSILRGTASRDDVDEAVRKLVKHEFPLLKGMDFIGTWVPSEVREIITRQLIRLLPSPSEPSTNGSSMNTPPTRTQRRSARR
jgi:hypothetical protein